MATIEQVVIRGIFLLTTLLITVASSAAQDRATKVRNDREKVEGDGFWIYNDLPRGLKLAKETGRPLVVVIRCIPCEACAQLDARVVSRDPAVQRLLDKFVCVRIVNANGLDLSLFQYDYDQSFAAFFLNADTWANTAIMPPRRTPGSARAMCSSN